MKQAMILMKTVFGVTLTVMKLDEELKTCLDLPCDSMGLTQCGEM